MVNSSTASLEEFKSQRMGGLLSGYESNVAAPTISGTSLSDSASNRLARSAPKKSTTAFMDNIRKSGQRLNQTALQGYANRNRQLAEASKNSGGSGGGGGGYRLPQGKGRPQTGGGRGQYGLTVPAAQSFNQMSSAYQRAWGSPLTVNSGGRTREEQAYLYEGWINRRPGFNLAAPPGGSLHESGIAVDIGGPITSSSTKQHAWLRANAAQYGWYWVGSNFGEPWHWENHPEWR